MADMLTVTLPNGEVKVNKAYITAASETVKKMLEEMGSDLTSIPLGNIDEATFSLIVKYLDLQVANGASLSPKPESEPNPDKYNSNNITPYDKAFAAEVEAIGMKSVFNLTMAANYLDMKNLLELMCKTIANMIKGHSPEDVKKKFAIDESGPISSAMSS
jgi:hypothetical protein